MPPGSALQDRQVQSSYAWLDRVAAHLRGERRDAYHAMRAVLGALRDRLPADIAIQLSSHMPLIVRGVFFDGFDPERSALRPRTVEQFIADVRTALAANPRLEAQPAINAVLDTLTHLVDRAVFASIHGVLPPPLRAYLALPARGAPATPKEASITLEA